MTPKSVPVYEQDPEPKQQLRTVPASPYAYNTCGANEVLAVSCRRNALQDLADNCIYQNSGVIEYSKNPACYFMTITLEDENPFEEIMEEVADALAGCGVAVKRHDEDDNDLRDIFFFDGTSLWSGNEDDLYLLHAGRLNGDAVDANDWFISYYGPDEDGADEHWDELEKNWNNVKKDLAYFRLSDYVRLCLNMEN